MIIIVAYVTFDLHNIGWTSLTSSLSFERRITSALTTVDSYSEGWLIMSHLCSQWRCMYMVNTILVIMMWYWVVRRQYNWIKTYHWRDNCQTDFELFKLMFWGNYGHVSTSTCIPNVLTYGTLEGFWNYLVKDEQYTPWRCWKLTVTIHSLTRKTFWGGLLVTRCLQLLQQKLMVHILWKCPVSSIRINSFNYVGYN